MHKNLEQSYLLLDLFLLYFILGFKFVHEGYVSY